ncbi:hypothetical protein ACFW6C_07535 [Streptomyces fungicidicus]|jgi:hypothetical protein|uniref:hypothetical protein n=1 Tax=Streptomyces fungicidicus TaxID=68203 RepID=UPI003694E43E
MSTPTEDPIVVTDPYEIPQTEETTDENGDTTLVGYPSDGAIPVEAPADTTSDGAPAPAPGDGNEPQGA